MSGELAVWDALLGTAGNADDGCVQKGQRDLVVATSHMGLNPPDSCSEGFDQLGIGSPLCSLGLGISEPSGDLQPPGRGV